MNISLLIGLTLLASLSPLLTLLRLWQIKEWRWDRLGEHIKREGAGQLYSRFRFWLTIAITVAMLLLIPASAWHGVIVILAALGLVNTVQIFLRRQLIPRWTQKAVSLFIMSMTLTATLAIVCLTFDKEGMLILPALPFIQSIIAAIAWFLLRPLDYCLKASIMSRARAIRKAHPDLTVIGITGSVGKTTTKELLSHILAERNPLTTPEHMNTEMGVSAWLTQVLGKPETAYSGTCRHAAIRARNQPFEALRPSGPNGKPEILIIEMGAYRIGEIQLLCSIAQPTIGIITSIGEQHVALFGSKENIRKGKGELVASLPANGHAFLNADSDMAAELKAMAAAPVTLVTTGGDGDIEAFDIEETRKGIRFTVDQTVFEIPLNGTHNVTNSLLAIACAKHLGMPLIDIAKRLRSFKPQEHTFEVRTERGITILDDTYNSSPQSFEAAISWAAAQPETNKVLLTTGIIELGDREAGIHTALAGKAYTVFAKAYLTDNRFLGYFKETGFNDDAQLISQAKQLEPGSLLVCIGRMPKSSIERFLPSQKPETRNQ